LALRRNGEQGTIRRATRCRPEEITGWAMSDTYIIEVGSQAAGIVVRDPKGYRFFAATHRFNPLEGRLFRNAREAERAARILADAGLARAA
jgi:hypothetical protein